MMNEKKEFHAQPLDSGDNGYYSVKEVADKIGFHKDTVYEWISSKGMPVRRCGLRGRISVYWPDFVKWWAGVSPSAPGGN